MTSCSRYQESSRADLRNRNSRHLTAVLMAHTIRRMDEKTRKLLSEALQLSTGERAEFVRELLETIDTPDNVEAAWTVELRRRFVEIRAGAEVLDWKDARAELHGTD